LIAWSNLSEISKNCFPQPLLSDISCKSEVGAKRIIRFSILAKFSLFNLLIWFSNSLTTSSLVSNRERKISVSGDLIIFLIISNILITATIFSLMIYKTSDGCFHEKFLKRKGRSPKKNKIYSKPTTFNGARGGVRRYLTAG